MTFKTKFRTIIGTVLLVLAFFSFPLLSVWKKSKVVDMSGENARLRSELVNIENQNIVLRYQVNQLRSRSRVEEVAKNELGLIYPNNEDVTILVRYPVSPDKKPRLGGIMEGIVALVK